MRELHKILRQSKSRRDKLRYKKAIRPAHFLISSETWTENLKYSSSWTPRYLTDDTRLTKVPSQTTWKSSARFSFLPVPNKMHSVLPICNDNLLSISHVLHLDNSRRSFSEINEGSQWEKTKAESSAYKLNRQSTLLLCKLLSEFMTSYQNQLP